MTFDGQPCVLRELQPSADRLDLAQIANDKPALADALRTMASLTAWAQMRSAGRDGSATVDALSAFASEPAGFAARLVAQARDLAAVTIEDWKNFCQAQDPTIVPKAEKPEAA